MKTAAIVVGLIVLAAMFTCFLWWLWDTREGDDRGPNCGPYC